MTKKENSIKKIIGILILTVSVFVTGFVGGRIFEGSTVGLLNKTNGNVTISEDENFGLFWEVWDTIKNGYVDEEKIDEQSMFYGSIKGMVDSVEDPATVFLDPDETEEFSLSNEGKYFEGIGAELGYDDGSVIIVSPLAGSPAKEAGIRPGDVILKIDDYEVSSTDTIFDVVALIRGEAGTMVILQVFRKGEFTPVDIEIERKEITVPSMSWELLEDNRDIVIINLDRFTDSSYLEWTKNWDTLVEEIVDSGVERIVLDLRGNPGGYFDAAIYAADDFLTDDEMIAQQRDRRGNLDVYKATKGGRLLNEEVIVLVDAGSASASEILAGALQENDRAELVGEETYGKGTAQSVVDFNDGSSLHLTILQWLLPDGEGLTRENPITPDIEVEYTDEDFVNGDDTRLEKAIEMLLN